MTLVIEGMDQRFSTILLMHLSMDTSDHFLILSDLCVPQFL